MAFKILARTREQTTTTGTGDITVSGLVSSDNVAFSAGMSIGDTTFMCVVSGDGVAWEEFLGTYSAMDTIQRTTTIINNSGTTGHISLSGTSRVFAIIPSDFGALFNALGGGDITKFVSGDGTFRTPPASIGWHPPVTVTTTAALPANTYNNGSSGVGATLTGNSNGAFPTVDGIAPVVGYRYLIGYEAAPANNGVFALTQLGDGSHPYILTRTSDFNSAGNINQADIVPVGPGGTVNGDRIFDVVASASPIVMGTTGFTFNSVVGPVMVGDSGSGGTKGLVPAPASGDAAAGKVLKADGTWAVPAGSSGAYGTATTVSAANTSGTIQITGIAAFVAYKLIVVNLLPATDGATATLQFGIGGTPTWATSNYGWNWHAADTVSNNTVGGSDSDSSINLFPNSLGNASHGVSGEFLISSAGDNSHYTIIGSHGGRVSYGGTRHNYHTRAGGTAILGGALTALRIVTSAGNWVSGSISLIPITL